MNLKENIEEVLTLSAEIATRQPAAISLLKLTYKALFGENIKQGCGDCMQKAFFKIQKHYFLNNDKLNFETMKKFEDRAFVLKKGRTLQTSFGDSNYLTNDTINDDKAAAFLKEFPGQIKHFEKFPTDEDGQLDLSAFAEGKKKADKNAQAAAASKEVAKKPAAAKAADKAPAAMTVVKDDKPVVDPEKDKVPAADETEGEGLFFEGDDIAVGLAVFTDEAMTVPVEDGEYPGEGVTIIVKDGLIADVFETDAEGNRIDNKEATQQAAEEIPASTEVVETVVEKPAAPEVVVKETPAPAVPAKQSAKSAATPKAAKPAAEDKPVSARTLQRRAAAERAAALLAAPNEDEAFTVKK